MTTRRDMLRTGAALATAAAWLTPGRALAQGRGNIVELRGEVLVNGNRLAPDGVVQTGDRVQTAPGSVVGFTIGRDAFLLRPGTDLTVTRGPSLFVADGARVVTGALLAVFGRASRTRMISTPTVSAGIRGTGFYVENRPDSTYFCTCFGVIDLAANGGQRTTVNSSRHQARRILADPGTGAAIVEAPFENHDDIELDWLARLVGQNAPGYYR